MLDTLKKIIGYKVVEMKTSLQSILAGILIPIITAYGLKN